MNEAWWVKLLVGDKAGRRCNWSLNTQTFKHTHIYSFYHNDRLEWSSYTLHFYALSLDSWSEHSKWTYCTSICGCVLRPEATLFISIWVLISLNVAIIFGTMIRLGLTWCTGHLEFGLTVWHSLRGGHINQSGNNQWRHMIDGPIGLSILSISLAGCSCLAHQSVHALLTLSVWFLYLALFK